MASASINEQTSFLDVESLAMMCMTVLRHPEALGTQSLMIHMKINLLILIKDLQRLLKKSTQQLALWKICTSKKYCLACR